MEYISLCSISKPGHAPQLPLYSTLQLIYALSALLETVPLAGQLHNAMNALIISISMIRACAKNATLKTVPVALDNFNANNAILDMIFTLIHCSVDLVIFRTV